MRCGAGTARYTDKSFERRRLSTLLNSNFGPHFYYHLKGINNGTFSMTRVQIGRFPGLAPR